MLAIERVPEGDVRRKPKTIRQECEGERYRFLSILPVPFEATTESTITSFVKYQFPQSSRARCTLNVNGVNS